MRNEKAPKIELTHSTKSVLEGPEKRLMELINGAEPKTDADKRMVEQINEIKKANRIIEIPSDF